jgi:hypothetical protein
MGFYQLAEEVGRSSIELVRVKEGWPPDAYMLLEWQSEVFFEPLSPRAILMFTFLRRINKSLIREGLDLQYRYELLVATIFLSGRYTCSLCVGTLEFQGSNA